MTRDEHQDQRTVHKRRSLKVSSTGARNTTGTTVSTARTENYRGQSVITAAELLRQNVSGCSDKSIGNQSEQRQPFSSQQQASTATTDAESLHVVRVPLPVGTGTDLDEEIRRLEADLAAPDDDDDDNDDSDSDSSSEYDGHGKEEDAGILNLSQLKEEARIAPLPSSALPAPPAKARRNKRAAVENDNDDGSDSADHRRSSSSLRAKKLRPSTTVAAPPPKTTTSGLESAVQELLRGYQARSAERLPFYCRVCATQCADETEFVEHRALPLHLAAVALERKATYCKLCRKQLTSPVQMKEHLQSRPHRERLDFMKNKQQQQQKPKQRHTSQRPNVR